MRNPFQNSDIDFFIFVCKFTCNRDNQLPLNKITMNILIGDDHLLVREVVEQIIRTLPEVESIDEVTDGNELLCKVNSSKYDLVIMDISIPGVSGLDVLQKMRHNKNMTNVLLYSFDPQRQHAMFALRHGASGYLAKNSVFEELTTAVRRILKGGKYVSAETA